MMVSEASKYASGEIRAQLGRKRKSSRWLSTQLRRSPNHIHRRLTEQSEWGIGELLEIAGLLDLALTDLLPDQL